MRLHSILSSSAVLAALGLVIMGGCGGSLEDAEDVYGSTLSDGELNAAPGKEGQVAGGKITICHVPPGNPANAHTLTVGGPAWNGHRNHKGDYMGPCAGGPDGGVPPPPPPPDGEPTTPDAGTPPPPPPPPPPGPTCAPVGGTCGGSVTCCDGLQCSGSTCEPIIN
jgi:hypothetical protein